MTATITGLSPEQTDKLQTLAVQIGPYALPLVNALADGWIMLTLPRRGDRAPLESRWMNNGIQVYPTPIARVIYLRRLDIVDSESNEDNLQLAELRAAWEMQRRRGRSQAVTVTCHSWRDSAGRLWSPTS